MNIAESELHPADRVDDIPRVLRALRLSDRDALRQRKLAGIPVAVRRDGHVVCIQPEDIPIPTDLDDDE